MIDNDANHLDPTFFNKLHSMLEEARKLGLKPFMFEGKRSVERQYELFGKGRTQLQLKKYGVPIKYANPLAKVVTWTLQSKHLEGKAADIVFDISKDPKVRVPSWNGDYKKLIELAPKYGIRSLAPLEVCHFELA